MFDAHRRARLPPPKPSPGAPAWGAWAGESVGVRLAEQPRVPAVSFSLNHFTFSQAAEGKELNVDQKSKIETIPRMEAEVAGLEKTLAAMS